MSECVNCISLMKRIKALQESVLLIEHKFDSIKEENKILEAEKIQWSSEKNKQQLIVTNFLNKNQDLVSVIQDELISVKNRLRKYEKVD